MPYCTRCGAKLEGVVTYCPYCGEAFDNILKVSEPSTSSQIGALKDEVSSLRRQLEEQRKPIISTQEKQDFSICWKCCCLAILILILMGIPWIIFF